MRVLVSRIATLFLALISSNTFVSFALADVGPPREDPCLNKKEGDSCSWLPLSSKKCRWEIFTQGKDQDPDLFQRYSGRFQKCEELPSIDGLLQKRCLSCIDGESEGKKEGKG